MPRRFSRDASVAALMPSRSAAPPRPHRRNSAGDFLVQSEGSAATKTRQSRTRRRLAPSALGAELAALATGSRMTTRPFRSRPRRASSRTTAASAGLSFSLGTTLNPSRRKPHVPRHISERRQRDQSVAGRRRPRDNRRNQSRPKAAPGMVRVNVNLLEVCSTRLEHLDIGKTDRRIIREGDPQMALVLCRRQFVQARRLAQNRLRRVSSEQPGGREFNGGEPSQIGWPRRSNRVAGCHVWNSTRDPTTAVPSASAGRSPRAFAWFSRLR